YEEAFNAADRANIAAKLGLAECMDEDLELAQSLYALLHAAEVDMTIFFRALPSLDVRMPTLAPFDDAFYDEGKRAAHEGAFGEWLTRYAVRVRNDPLPGAERRARMDAANPRYVLRNYLAQQAIERAEQGDPAGIHELLEVLRHPYEEQPGRAAFAQRRPDWARERAGCSMLSCSS
ncbi:MAG: protein adenylyltransferase SelO family protein, partial [Usitatibacter sp.]